MSNVLVWSLWVIMFSCFAFMFFNQWREFKTNKGKKLLVSFMKGFRPNEVLVMITPLVPVNQALAQEIYKLYDKFTEGCETKVVITEEPKHG